MMRKLSLLFSLVVVGTLAGSCVSSTKNLGTSHFMDRDINLKPFFTSFPYTIHLVSLDANKVFYFKEGDKKILMELSLDEAQQGLFKQGRKLSDLDFSKRTFWDLKYNPADRSLYWVGDEDNTEITNIYRMDLKSLKIQILTKVRYIYGYRFNKSYDKIAYSVRTEDGVNAKAEIQIIDLKSKKMRTVARDNKKIRYYWGDPSWSPDEKTLIVSTIYGDDRNRRQIISVNTKNGKTKELLNPKKNRIVVNVMKNWINSSEFIFSSDEKGKRDIYSMNIKTGKIQRITRLNTDAVTVHYRKGQLLFVERTPVRSKIVLYNQSKGKFNKVFEKKYFGNLSIDDVSSTGRIILNKKSYAMKVYYEKAQLGPNGISEPTPVVQMNQEKLAQLVHTEKVEEVEYETFDIDPKTNKKRKIPALLYHPKNPQTGAHKMAALQSFYGYWNRYRTSIQILQAAGAYVLTPAPRGSSGLGREYSGLNDKDLGGNEIIDIISGGQFLSKKLNIQPKNMGVFGHSHGGYASMRLMTFPGEVNGNKADFPWGFGIASAGFSDIEHFYRNCNIPTWVIKEAGDPDKEPQKIRSRSPLYNTQHLRGRLLILHGSNDKRVPVEGSRQMYEKLSKTAPNQVVYKEWQGQGHSIKGLENQIRVYDSWLSFLENTLTKNR